MSRLDSAKKSLVNIWMKSYSEHNCHVLYFEAEKCFAFISNILYSFYFKNISSLLEYLLQIFVVLLYLPSLIIGQMRRGNFVLLTIQIFWSQLMRGYWIFINSMLQMSNNHCFLYIFTLMVMTWQENAKIFDYWIYQKQWSILFTVPSIRINSVHSYSTISSLEFSSFYY